MRLEEQTKARKVGDWITAQSFGVNSARSLPPSYKPALPSSPVLM